MRAELAAMAPGPGRYAFAAGCLRAVVDPALYLRVTGYAVLVAAAVGLAKLSGAPPAFPVEGVALGRGLPVVWWRLGYRAGLVGAVAPSRAARLGRGMFLAV